MTENLGDGTGRDIVELILEDHQEFHRRFAEIFDEPAPDYGSLWPRLCAFLENHAHAEEQTLYPALVKHAAKGKEQASDGVHEHNEIRNAIGEVGEHEVGSERFLLALRQVAATNDHHMAEEEQDVLPAFRSSTSTEERVRLGEAFAKDERAHEGGRGLSAKPIDPQSVISGAAGGDAHPSS